LEFDDKVLNNNGRYTPKHKNDGLDEFRVKLKSLSICGDISKGLTTIDNLVDDFNDISNKYNNSYNKKINNKDDILNYILDNEEINDISKKLMTSLINNKPINDFDIDEKKLYDKIITMLL